MRPPSETSLLGLSERLMAAIICRMAARAAHLYAPIRTGLRAHRNPTLT